MDDNHNFDIESIQGTFYFHESVSVKHKFVSFKIQADSIMDNFDFEKTHKAMVALNWSWAVGNYDANLMKIPTIDELKAEAYRLLRDCYLEPTSRWMISTGGLRVNKEDGLLQLQFVIDEWDLFGYDDDELQELEDGNG